MANSCLSLSHLPRMDSSSFPSFVGFFSYTTPCLFSCCWCFILMLSALWRLKGSQLSITVSKSFKMLRCPSSVFAGLRILYEWLSYWHPSNHRTFPWRGTPNNLSSLILLCFVHYIAYSARLPKGSMLPTVAQLSSHYHLFSWSGTRICFMWCRTPNINQVRILSLGWAKLQLARVKENDPMSFSSGSKSNHRVI